MVRHLVGGLLLLAVPAFGQAKWTVDSSSVSFKITNAGIPVEGIFKGLEAQIDFNPRKLMKSQITASVDASTVDTGIRIRNNHLRKSDFFHVEAYPQITLRSREFRKQEEDQFLGIFAIDLKGKEDLVTVPFSFRDMGTYAILEGNFEIDRTDYHVGDTSLLLANNVQINIWVKVK